MASDVATVPMHHHLEPGSEHDRLDLRRLLEEPLFQGHRILSGAAALARQITWCLPFRELGQDEGNLDGVVVVADTGALRGPVAWSLKALGARGVAAVMFVDPQDDLSALAQEAGPDTAVIALPEGVGFTQVNRIVAELALAKDAHVLRYGLTVHQSLAELLYRGSGLGALARQLSRLSGCPVGILDPAGRMLSFEYEFRDVKLPNAEAVVASLAQAAELTAIDPSQHDPRHDTRLVDFELGERTFTSLLKPILLGGRHDGWIALVEPVPEPVWHDMARHEVVLEQATMIVGTEMLRLRSVEAAEERARGDFVHALLHGRLSNPQELAVRAAYYDFDVAGRYAAVVARQVGVAGSPESQVKMQRLAGVAAQVLERTGLPPMVTVAGDVLAIVLQVESQSLQRGSQQTAGFARTLHRELARLDERTLTVTYGQPVTGAARIVESYREARVALGVCERMLISGVSGYGEVRVFGAVLELATSQRGQVFAREVLEPLRTATRKSGGDLEEAVVAYVEEGGNLNAAARRLSLHRNTMLYKLERASRVLGMDLRRAEDQFTFWLAHRVDLLVETQAAVGRELGSRS